VSVAAWLAGPYTVEGIPVRIKGRWPELNGNSASPAQAGLLVQLGVRYADPVVVFRTSSLATVADAGIG